MKSLVTKAVLTLAGLTLAAGLSGCKPKGPEERAEWVTKKIASELDLNKDQKAKLNAVKDQILASQKANQAQRDKNFEMLKQMIMSDKLDQSQAKSLMNERNKVMEKSFDEVFVKLQDFHASLTPEQKKEAVEELQDLNEKWDGKD